MAHHENGSHEELIRHGREPRRERRRPWWSGFAAVIAVLLVAASSIAVARNGSRAHDGTTHPSNEQVSETSIGALGSFTVRTLVPVGSVDLSAAALAVNPTTGRVYVAMRCMTGGNVCRPTRDQLRVIDGMSGRTLDIVPVGPGVSAVAVDALRDVVYVAAEGANDPVAAGANVAVVDARTDRVVKRMALPVSIGNVAIDARRDLLFGTDARSGDLLTIDPVAGRVVRHTPVAGPRGLVAVSSASGLVYVATAPVALATPGATAFGTLTVVDGSTGRIVARAQLPPLPAAIAVDDTLERVFVAAESNIVVALDGPSAAVLRRIAIERPVYGLAVGGGMLVDVGGRDESLTRVTLLDPDTFVGTASVSFPGGSAVAIDPKAGRVYAIRTDVLAIIGYA